MISETSTHAQFCQLRNEMFEIIARELTNRFKSPLYRISHYRVVRGLMDPNTSLQDQFFSHDLPVSEGGFWDVCGSEQEAEKYIQEQSRGLAWKHTELVQEGDIKIKRFWKYRYWFRGQYLGEYWEWQELPKPASLGFDLCSHW